MEWMRRAAVIGLNALAITGTMALVAYAGTREENIQKIRGFLSDQTVKENMQKKHGASSVHFLLQAGHPCLTG